MTDHHSSFAHVPKPPGSVVEGSIQSAARSRQSRVSITAVPAPPAITGTLPSASTRIRSPVAACTTKEVEAPVKSGVPPSIRVFVPVAPFT